MLWQQIILLHSCAITSVSQSIFGNGHLQIVVADFEEHQHPQEKDVQERSKDNALRCTRNAICNFVALGILNQISNLELIKIPQV